MADLHQFFQLTQQAQGRLQQLESELACHLVEAQAGGGMVRVTADGRGQVRGVWIDPTVFAEKDADLVSELVLAAVAEVQRKAAEVAQAELGRSTPSSLPFVP